jgi:hypothetical protein
MFRNRVGGSVRYFAKMKDKPFLSDAIAKAAIGKDLDVATSFVSAFAPVVHRQNVIISQVSRLSETIGLSLARDMKHDIALRYKVGDTDAVMEIIPHHYSRALVEIQLRSEHYLPGRSLAHASGHFLASVEDVAKAVKAEKLRKQEAKLSSGEQNLSSRKPLSKESQKEYDSAVYTAYIHAEPVHLLMLSDFCYAYDTTAKVWRAPKLSPVLNGSKYGWVSPLFSTFRLTTEGKSMKLNTDDQQEDPGPNTFASSLRDRLSITIIHLPLVPSSLDDNDAWNNVVTQPEHQVALKSAELRKWLHYLAHTSVKDGKVDMPLELRTNKIFRKSADMAEDLLRTPGGFYFTEKEMADFSLQAEHDVSEAKAAGDAALEREKAAAAKREAAAAEREAALEREKAAAAEREAALEREKAAAAKREAALEREKAAAAKREAAAAERLAALEKELKRLNGSGSGTQ